MTDDYAGRLPHENDKTGVYVKGLPPRPSGDPGKVYDVANQTAVAQLWPTGIRLALLAQLSQCETLNQAIAACETWENPTYGTPPQNADKLASYARSLRDKRARDESGVHKGPDQLIIPGAGDVSQPKGKGKLFAMILGGSAAVGGALYVWSKYLRPM